MTVLDALNIEVGNKDLCNLNLINRGLDPASEYTASIQDELEIVKAFCFRTMLTQPDFSEDGFSIKHDKKFLSVEMNRIFTKNNLTDEIPNASPTIKDSTGLW